ncbi:plasmid partitioning/stability family protein [Klebsiella michiganensis]
MTDNRKCSFSVCPERNAADRVASDWLAEAASERAWRRAMRAMMLCGAAIDEAGRTPAVPDR